MACSIGSLSKFLLFYLFLQNTILTYAGKDCLNRKFKADQKVLIEFFFDEGKEYMPTLKNVIRAAFKPNGPVSLKQRVGAQVTKNNQGQLDCGIIDCIMDRKTACMYKNNPDAYDKGTEGDWVLMSSVELATCICNGDADDILIENSAARAKYQIPIDDLPTAVIDGQYDPCFQPTSFEAVKTYFCTAYDNALSICKK